MKKNQITAEEAFVRKRLWQYAAFAMAFLILMIHMTPMVMSASDVFDVATTASTDLLGKFGNLANAVFPLAIVICGICMLFTHDQRKFELEKSILIGLFLAYVLILLAKNGTILQTIQNISGLSSKAAPATDYLHKAKHLLM